MEFVDATGQPVSERDIADAKSAVSKAIVKVMQLAAISPELAVNLPNILRCLQELERRR